MFSEFENAEAVQSRSASLDTCLIAGTRPERPIRSLGETEFLLAGSGIYLQDDPALYLFRLISGTVSTSLVMENGSRRVTGFLSEGDYFGSVFSDRYRSSAEAITDCTFIRYSRRNWSSKEIPNSFYWPIILDALRLKRRTAEEHVLLLGGVTACARVAGFLLYLSRRAAQRGEPDNPISIPMTRYHIADFLGTTSESVSRCLSKLKQSRVIRMDTPDIVTLVDRHMLADIPRGY